MNLYDIDLDDTEVKLLLVAIRQVEHTFTIAEAQSVAGGEPLPDYQEIRESYRHLHRKLSALLEDEEEEDESDRPYIVK